MTIEEHEKSNKSFDIEDEYELDFTQPDDEKEANENLLWGFDYIIKNSDVVDSKIAVSVIGTIVRSYYGGIIGWD